MFAWGQAKPAGGAMTDGAAEGKEPETPEEEVPLVALRVEGGGADEEEEGLHPRHSHAVSHADHEEKGGGSAASVCQDVESPRAGAAPSGPETMDTDSEQSKADRSILLFKVRALATCALHNAAQALCLKYSLGPDVVDSRGLKYITTTAVVCCEIGKMTTSLMIIYVTTGGFRGMAEEIRTEMVDKPVECLKLIIPSALYTFQNNLQFIALANISAAVFQVTSQIKILTTALFTVILLRRTLGMSRWGALLVLFIGCIFVNLDAQQQRAASRAGGGAAASGKTLAKQIFGLLCVLTGTVTSGLAGVYFEKVLKGAKTSLWIRQLQLGVGGIAFSVAGAFSTDGARIMKDGFFQGYTPWVCFVIVLNVMGGLIVAVVVKYTDTLAKAFAVSASIVIASLVSVPLFGFRLRALFCVGAFLVILSVFLYESIVQFNARTNIPLAILILGSAYLIQNPV